MLPFGRELPCCIACLLALGACGLTGSSDSDASVVAVRDSAGIEIVETPRAVMEALPEWTLEAELDLGGVDAQPEHQFFRVNGARLLRDGGVAVVNSGTQEIRFFDASGGLQASTGRDGDGPGEFRFPTGLFALPGDSLLVFDRRLRRISLIGPDHGVSRSATLEGVQPNVFQIGILPGATLLIESMTFTLPSSATPEDGRAELLLFGLDGTQVGRIGDFHERWWVRSGESVGNPALGPFTTFAVVGSDVWVGTAEDYEVRSLDRDGTTTRISRWWGPDRAVTAADRGDWLAARLAEADEAEQASVREAAASQVFADEKAAYYGILGMRRNLWIMGFQPFPEETRRWLILDDQGRPRAFVIAPSTFRVRDVVDGRVAGTIDDQLGVEHVVIYRIVKE
jgi:hypothetical protein